ncbi:hypothetical protein Syun_024169 [Stephania yunnanensis]|uniref:Uncharacterized protein n=1 Tax=Stephania yunnanensis TaxID=152371 RepID=A0AAP0FQ98_9MAGN
MHKNKKSLNNRQTTQTAYTSTNGPKAQNTKSRSGLSRAFLGLPLHSLAQLLSLLAHLRRHRAQRPPEVVDNVRHGRQRRDAEGPGDEEAGDGECDGDGGGDDNGAEDDKERRGEGEADKGAGEGEAGEGEEDTSDRDHGDHR